MTALAISEVLDRAADLIEPEGAWGQGGYGAPGSGCYCAIGAVRQVLGGIVPRIAEDWFDLNVEPFAGLDSWELEDWNDAPDRTQAEVVAKLREAAALAREQGK